jgi:UDP-N-acetylmuramoyl-tripeptide--D-alanyl-D-alanine ligase
MDLSTLYTLFLSAKGITTDSRRVGSQSLYFALKGDRFDGNDFAQEALDQGALASVVDRLSLKDKDPRFIYVDDVLQTLQNLAHHHRNQCKATVIALTGSNGKTTTKELFKAVLSKAFNCQATEGNLNNHIGVPLTLLSLNPTTEFAIVEMGANHQGEIETLCKIAAPDWGYITNFGKAHLEGFGGLEGVVKGKTELYRYLMQNQGKILVHGDDLKQEEAVANYPVVRFGTQNNFDYPLHYLPQTSDGLCLTFKEKTICSSLYGRYNLPNIAAAVALGAHFGVSIEQVATAIGEYQSHNNRSQLWQKGNYHFVLDAYNANPTSMRAALESFAQKEAVHKGLILGDMLELGPTSKAEHQAILDYALQLDVEAIYLVGAIWSSLIIKHPKVQQFESSAVLCETFQKELPKTTTLLLKGSRSIALEQVLVAFEKPKATP